MSTLAELALRNIVSIVHVLILVDRYTAREGCRWVIYNIVNTSVANILELAIGNCRVGCSRRCVLLGWTLYACNIQHTQNCIKAVIRHPLFQVLALQFRPFDVQLPHIVCSQLLSISVHLHFRSEWLLRWSKQRLDAFTAICHKHTSLWWLGYFQMDGRCQESHQN